MEEDMQKRNTDCVYFLASPFTCKKGIECEYRHSESARLNPRDCWYWLSGNCYNPTCAFRHPPLEVHSETSLEPALHQPSVPVNKTNVPCYFYFNGFCNKGDRCSFLHDPNGVTPAWKSSKTASTATDGNTMENKTPTGSDTGLISEEVPHSLPGRSLKEVVNVELQSNHNLQKSFHRQGAERSPSAEISEPECVGAKVKSESPLPVEDFFESRSPVCPDQSSEDRVENQIEPEEWWESSPGFDVLVDDGSENLGFEDDQGYLMANDREVRGSHLPRYEYEDQATYEHMDYSDMGILYDRGIYDSYDHLENDHIPDYVRNAADCSVELDPISFQKRKILPRELEVVDRDSMDLRNLLRKRRKIMGHQAFYNPKGHGSSHSNGWSQEQPGRFGKGRLRHRRRFTTEVGQNTIRSHSESENGSNNTHQQRISRHFQSRQNRSRHRENESRQARPHFLSSEISRGPDSRDKRRSIQDSTAFTGPKTLAQIKEEKRKAKENGGGFENSRHLNKSGLEAFQGPKPLSEILKKKKKLDSASDDNSSGRSSTDHIKAEENEYLFDMDGLDGKDEDDGGLEKNLVNVLS